MNKKLKKYETDDTVAETLIDKLIGRMGLTETREFVREILTSAVKLGKESKDIGDLKLANTALKELRYAFKVFAPYRKVKKVIIFGSARSKPASPEYKMAEKFARKMSEKGYMIVTGGGPGVMEAGNKGALRGNDFALNIRLPYEQKERLINFKYFFTRKLFFVKETDATAMFPGGFGTLDEGFEMLTLAQTGKSKPRPIVLIEPKGSDYWHDCRRFFRKQLVKGSYIGPRDESLFTIATSVEEAVKYIDDFYRVYHSLRFVDGLTIIRLHRAVSDRTLTSINEKFADILISGDIERSAPTQKEIQDNEFLALPRLSLSFDHRSFDRLHELIRAINQG